jgi:hypothetical protein
MSRPFGSKNRKGKLSVEAVTAYYALGFSQVEIGDIFDVTQGKVTSFMKRSGICTRTAAKRDQGGTRNHVWTGDKASYVACHKRVKRLRGPAFGCGICGSKNKQIYHWANLTGNYLNMYDFMSMCVKCHRLYDNQRRKMNGGKSTRTR